MSSLVLVAILAFVAVFFDTLLLNAFIWFVSAMAIVELFRATKILQHRSLAVLAIVQAFVISFSGTGFVGAVALPALFLIALSYFALLVKNYGLIELGTYAKAFLFAWIIPLFFSCAIFLRDRHGAELGAFYILLAIGAAWLSDTSAYFVGTFFGKHKLAPKVSPKKTIEGTIGGLVISTGLILLFSMYFPYMIGRLPAPPPGSPPPAMPFALDDIFGEMVRIDFVMLAVFSPIFSLIGMLGDLSASAIKREYEVKDFGGIMPGHGGVLDRFDSVLFTLPAVYVVASYFELIALVRLH